MEAHWITMAWPFPALAALAASAASIWLSLPIVVKKPLDEFGWAGLVFGAFVALSKGKASGNLFAYALGAACLVGIPVRASWSHNAGAIALLILGGLVLTMAYLMVVSPASLWGLWFAGAALVAFCVAFTEALMTYVPWVRPSLWERMVMWFPATALLVAGAYLSLLVWRRSGNRLGLALAGLCGAAAAFGLWGLLAMLWQGLKSLAAHGADGAGTGYGIL